MPPRNMAALRLQVLDAIRPKSGARGVFVVGNMRRTLGRRSRKSQMLQAGSADVAAIAAEAEAAAMAVAVVEDGVPVSAVAKAASLPTLHPGSGPACSGPAPIEGEPASPSSSTTARSSFIRPIFRARTSSLPNASSSPRTPPPSIPLPPTPGVVPKPLFGLSLFATLQQQQSAQQPPPASQDTSSQQQQQQPPPAAKSFWESFFSDDSEEFDDEPLSPVADEVDELNFSSTMASVPPFPPLKRDYLPSYIDAFLTPPSFPPNLFSWASSSILMGATSNGARKYSTSAASMPSQEKGPAVVLPETEEGHPDCPHRHPFGFIDGDVVLIPGFYGSNLHHHETDVRAWITLESVWNMAKHTDIALKMESKYGDDDHYIPKRLRIISIVDYLGPFNVCKDMVKEMKELETCKKGSLRFHEFPYDWRRELQHASQELETFLENIYAKNGGKKITVIAHSMGGLITLRTVNRRPELFRGVVFEGTPFGPVPLIVWAFRRGAPLIPNPRLFGSSLHFLCRSAYNFLPRDGMCLIDEHGNDIVVDFFDAKVWRDLRLTSVFKRARTNEEIESLTNYVHYALTCAQSFRQTIQHNPSTQYPPFAVVSSDRWPTAVGFRASVATVSPSRPIVDQTVSAVSEAAEAVTIQTQAVVDLLNKQTRRISTGFSSLLKGVSLTGSLTGRPTTAAPADADGGDGKASDGGMPAGGDVNPSQAMMEHPMKVPPTPLTGTPVPPPKDKAPTPEAGNMPEGGDINPSQAMLEHAVKVPPAPVSGTPVLPPKDKPSSSTSTLPPTQREVRIHMPIKFVPGDGVVSVASTSMPEGYKFERFSTAVSHPGMLNDLQTLANALRAVCLAKPGDGEKGVAGEEGQKGTAGNDAGDTGKVVNGDIGDIGDASLLAAVAKTP
ncbi:hypothetical protein HK101_001821 [Irineochytrium annulatum]|nr:hypothetical protein HK101_001821 [Irineochytrium annulatum]